MMSDKLIRAVEHKDDIGFLTEYERLAWEGAKDMGWFNPERTIWYQSHKSWEASHFVRRGYFVATRLYDKGYFEHRLVGEYPFLEFEFRHINPEGDKDSIAG